MKFKPNGMVALLDGCPVECAIYEMNGERYVNTGPLFRKLTKIDGRYTDSDGRYWTVRERKEADHAE